MTKTKLRGMGRAYAIGEGDLFPIFFPQYIGRWGGTKIVGVMGLYAKKFEIWWENISSKFRKSDGIPDLVIGIHISNFALTMDMEYFDADDKARIEDWIAKIVGLSRLMFEPGSDIFDIVTREELAGVSLSSYVGPSVKTYAFNIWLRLQRPGITLPVDFKWLDEERIASRRQEYDFLKAHYGDIAP